MDVDQETPARPPPATPDVASDVLVANAIGRAALALLQDRGELSWDALSHHLQRMAREAPAPEAGVARAACRRLAP